MQTLNGFHVYAMFDRVNVGRIQKKRKRLMI